jgi:hypothetical protein
MQYKMEKSPSKRRTFFIWCGSFHIADREIGCLYAKYRFAFSALVWHRQTLRHLPTHPQWQAGGCTLPLARFDRARLF